MNSDPVTYFAQTDYRNQQTPFGIKASDRSRHMYVIGKTGMGKSTMLENLAYQDIQNGEGIAFVDPHGATAEKLLTYVPPERMSDVIYFAPFDLEHPIAFNIMEDVGYDKRHLVANGLMSAFKKIWVDAWSARMEYILNNCILALLEYPGSTLLSVNKMLVDKAYRKKVVDNISDPSVKAFWTQEFAKYTDRYAQEATPAIQNKIGQFTSNPLIRNIVGQPHSSFDIREAMDNQKILIINLSKGRMGEQNANLLGSMLVTKIYLAAMSRADLPDDALAKLPNFYFYVDEFQSFANESFADILSEARKYKLNLTIAHQYIEQMPEEVRAAVFGNVGTMVTFRIGSYDAEIFEKEFAPRFTAQDIVNLGFAQIYLKLMIDGIGSHPFSAVTLPPIPKSQMSYHENIIDESRRRYAAPRKFVEEQISSWHDIVEEEEKGNRGGGGGRGGNNNNHSQNARHQTGNQNRNGNNRPRQNHSNAHQPEGRNPRYGEAKNEKGDSNNGNGRRSVERIPLDALKPRKTPERENKKENTLKNALADAIAKHDTEKKEEGSSGKILQPKKESAEALREEQTFKQKAKAQDDFTAEMFQDGNEKKSEGERRASQNGPSTEMLERILKANTEESET